MTLQASSSGWHSTAELHGAFGEDIGCRGVIRHAGVRGNSDRETSESRVRRPPARTFAPLSSCCPIRLLLPTMMGWMDTQAMAGAGRRIRRILQAQRAGWPPGGVKPTPRGKPSGRPFNARFTDIAEQAGLRTPAIYALPITSLHPGDHGAGIAFLDYDNDAGWTSSCSPARAWMERRREPPTGCTRTTATDVYGRHRAGRLTRTGWAVGVTSATTTTTASTTSSSPTGARTCCTATTATAPSPT